MPNLGSDNTPVVGQDFSLPAGAQIDEDGGDLVVRDSGGSIVLRRDEGAGTWDFVSGDLTGIASLETGNIDSKNGYEDTTASRSIGTWYQNTTGGDLNVAVSVNCDTDSQIFHMSFDVSETQTQNRVDQFIEDPSSSGKRITVTSTVPDGFYYRVVNNAGATASLRRWVEQ